MRKVAPYILVVVLGLSGGLLPSPQIVGAQQAEPPLLNHIHPDKIPAGTPTFTLRLEGKRFQDGAQVLFDGVALPSSRISEGSRRALAEIDASLAAVLGTHTVQLINPDGGATTIETMEVVARDPDLRMRLGGNSIQEDQGIDFAFSVTGEGYDVNSEGIIWGVSAVATAFVSDTELQLQFSSDLATDPARVPIFIRNKGGHYSNVEIFFVVPQPASLRFVDPDSVLVGTDPFDIEVRGDGLKAGAQLVVNGVHLETTAKKNSRLTATVPGVLRSMPGLLSVRAEQDGIQSADITIVVSPSTDPFIFSVSPSHIRVGEESPKVDLNGANFGDDVSAFIDGEEAKIVTSTKRHLVVKIPPELVESSGTHRVEVKDADGHVSNAGTFVVIPDVTVTTLVGDDKDGFNEGCVSGDAVRLRRPRRLAFGPDGLLYFTDQYNHSIRTINVATGEVCTVVGTGDSGYNDTGNVAGKPPTFSYPNGVVVTPNGTIYVAENGNNVVRRIRRVSGTLIVDTFAGQNEAIVKPDRQARLNSTRDGLDGFRDGEASDAAFRLPDDIIVAPDGSLYVADANNHAIRHITMSGADVTVETIAGNGVPGFADGAGETARLNTPVGLTLSLDGKSLFVADMGNGRIRRIDLLTRNVETYAGSGVGGSVDGMAPDASFARPIGVALDADGVLYVAELDANAIRRIDPAGDVTTLAGTGIFKKFRDGDGRKATFNGPRGLAIDRVKGVLYVADYENFRIRAIALR
jgi:sugar lactone lactonase YvrE